MTDGDTKVHFDYKDIKCKMFFKNTLTLLIQ